MDDDDNRPTRAELDAMLGFGGDEPDRKHAGFRLMGERLDPDAITLATGLTPHHSHRKGEQRPASRVGKRPPPWRSGIWILDSEDGLPQTNNHLEDHFTWLLDQLEPHIDVLRRICAERQLSADFYCGYFMGQANSGFVLSAQTLTRIAALDLTASVGVDIYGENADRELRYWLEDAIDRTDSG